jgi:hypothetical protein
MMRKCHVRFGGGRLEKESMTTSLAAYPTVLKGGEPWKANE